MARRTGDHQSGRLSPSEAEEVGLWVAGCPRRASREDRMATEERSFSAHGLAARERCHAACFAKRVLMSTFTVTHLGHGAKNGVLIDDTGADHLVEQPGQFFHGRSYSTCTRLMQAQPVSAGINRSCTTSALKKGSGKGAQR